MALDDQQDFERFFGHFFSTLAGATRWEGWRISRQEASDLAGPLARILQRHGWVQKAREITDPIALIVAALAIVGLRAIGYFAYLKSGQGVAVMNQRPIQRPIQSEPQMSQEPAYRSSATPAAATQNGASRPVTKVRDDLNGQVSDEALAELRFNLEHDVA